MDSRPHMMLMQHFQGSLPSVPHAIVISSMNSSIELAFQREGSMDAYICEALLFCLAQGDYVDRDDVKANIANEKAVAFVFAQLDTRGIK